jgi:hypothetical protein
MGITPDDINYWFPEIEPRHVESEETVRIFHGAFYDMVEAKYGEEKARQLLGIPQRKARELQKLRNARVLWE